MERSDPAKAPWFTVNNIDEIISPSLLIYPERIESNIKKMIEMAGKADKIRPHVKTHKMAEVIRLQMKHGITRFKTSTISETEMVARCGAKNILLAIQPVGPNLKRFFQLKKEFPDTIISCIADSEDILNKLSDMSIREKLETAVWLDINNGMNRTGIEPGKQAIRLFHLINDLPGLKAEGLHVYDGHIHESDLSLRRQLSEAAFAPIYDMIEILKKKNSGQIRIVAGGTPTFPVHALHKGVESSPGTLLLWDWGYSISYTDMKFLHAAVLLTRVISKPAKDLLCLDLGHKAIASEMPQPRVKFLNIDDYLIINHNEEHMVIRTSESGNFKPGDHLYGIPWHICPTVDRHDHVTVIRENEAIGQWKVEARMRKLTY